MIQPQWTWRLATPDGSRGHDHGQAAGRADGFDPVFVTRFDAELWLGEHWRELRSTGVQTATLLARGEPVTVVRLDVADRNLDIADRNRTADQSR